MKTVALFALAVVATACAPESERRALDDIPAGRMAGSLSTVDGFYDRVVDDYVTFDGNYLDIEMHAVGDYGWAMMYGWVSLEQPIEDGDVIVLRGPRASAFVGCAGPEQWQADYDNAPETVEIRFDEVPEPDVDAPEEAPDGVGVEVPEGSGTGTTPVDEGDMTAPTTTSAMMSRDEAFVGVYRVTVTADFGDEGVLTTAAVFGQY